MILRRKLYTSPPSQSSPQQSQQAAAGGNQNPAAAQTKGAGGITMLDQMKLANSQNKTSVAQMNGVMRYQATQSRNAIKSNTNAIQAMGLRLNAVAGSKRLADASLNKNAPFLKTVMTKAKPAPVVKMKV